MAMKIVNIPEVSVSVLVSESDLYTTAIELSRIMMEIHEDLYERDITEDELQSVFAYDTLRAKGYIVFRSKHIDDLI